MSRNSAVRRSSRATLMPGRMLGSRFITSIDRNQRGWPSATAPARAVRMKAVVL